MNGYQISGVYKSLACKTAILDPGTSRGASEYDGVGDFARMILLGFFLDLLHFIIFRHETLELLAAVDVRFFWFRPFSDSGSAHRTHKHMPKKSIYRYTFLVRARNKQHLTPLEGEGSRSPHSNREGVPSRA